MNNNRHITISDVASHAKCSTATVSRAINEPWRVNSVTLKRIQDSVSELGYKPNIRAQMLARSSSGGSMCFLLSNRRFWKSFHAKILQGTANRAEEMKLQMLFASCTYSPTTPPADIELPHILAARGVIDGVIVAGANYPNIISALDKLGLPYVLFGTNFIGGDDTFVPASVYVDDEGGGYQATSHLIELGHERIRFVGDISLPWYRRRYLGYTRAMAEAGLPTQAPTGSAFKGELEMGYAAVRDLRERGENFTGLFVAGDEGAFGAIKALKAEGLSVPDDVSVVGFNDEESAHLSEPPLTTVAIPTEEVGGECVSMLSGVIDESIVPTEPVVMSTRLIVRESTSRRGDRQ